jgi:hypothetical protein
MPPIDDLFYFGEDKLSLNAYTLTNNWTSTDSSIQSPQSSASSNGKQEASRKKKMERDEQAPSVCIICSSPATCYHYQAPSCNGKRVWGSMDFLPKSRNEDSFARVLFGFSDEKISAAYRRVA